MKILQNLGTLEACDQPTLVRLCRQLIDIVERLLTEAQNVDAVMHRNAAAFTFAGMKHGEAMRLILDDIEKIGPAIVGTELPPSRQ